MLNIVNEIELTTNIDVHNSVLLVIICHTVSINYYQLNITQLILIKISIGEWFDLLWNVNVQIRAAMKYAM